ncbi:MAG: hypothetical protein ACRERC_01115 [Candidatus Binatia bacterium]
MDERLVRLWGPFVLVVGIGLTLLGDRSTPVPDALSAKAPVVVVLLPGPGPAGLEALDLLSRLRRPNPSGMPWLGGDLIDVPGASDYQLWRRAVTGRISPEPDTVDLLAQAGIPVYGDWNSAPDAASDQVHLVQARMHAEVPGGHGPAAVVLLNCSRNIEALATDPCRRVFLDAVQLLEAAAGQGGVGLLLTVPMRGFPQIGSVWVIGGEVQEGTDFRLRMIDMAPAMLRLLGLPLPPALDGGPAYDMMRFEQLFHRPLRWEGGGT